MTSGSRLLLFLVSPRFSRNGLLRSIGLSFSSSISLLGTWSPAVVISVEILGSCSCHGLCWTALSSEGRARGCGDAACAAHALCASGVFIAVKQVTLPPLAIESNELLCVRKSRTSFSGTAGGGGGVGPRRRISGPRLRRARSQKYVNIAPAIRKTAKGIMARPAIDAAARPELSCAGAAISDIVAGMVGCASDAIVNCCGVEMVACCMRIVGKGDDDGIEGVVGGSCGCWPRATLAAASVTSVAVCDADRPSICTACSIGRIVVQRLNVTCRWVRHQRTNLDWRTPLAGRWK